MVDTAVQKPTAVDLIDEDQPGIASLDDVYLDGTLVLIGCGKAKRDSDDEVDVHQAKVGPDESFGPDWTDETGPAWAAKDLYTSTYFQLKREFAEVVSSWAREGESGWGILSAEHDVLMPWKAVKPYDTTLGTGEPTDLGDDPTNPDHIAPMAGHRRPDGQEIVTEVDQWAANVAYSLMRWIANHRERRANPWENTANTLLVLAGQKYVEPLRERGVFEYGIARMTGADPNNGFTQPLHVRYLFEEIDAGGFQEQMAWLSDATSRLEDLNTTEPESEQNALDTTDYERYSDDNQLKFTDI